MGKKDTLEGKTGETIFVLVEPVYRGNIGAAARVVNNFGFEKIRLVGTVPKKEDHYLAVHSEDIMDNIEIYDDLSGALTDIDLAIAVTRRSGRKKKTDINSSEIRTFVSNLKRQKTAFVFGRETYGLKDEEIELCPIRCFIPANPSFPSLNLAQAVAVIAYELSGNAQEAGEDDHIVLAGQKRIDRTINDLLDNLTGIGYFESGNPDNTRKQLQNLLLRSFATEENLIFLEKMFDRIGILYRRKLKPD